MSIAFGLRAEYEGTVNVDGQEVPAFSCGPIAVGTTREIDLSKALADGNGVIVVDEMDNELITALGDYPALKRVAVPDRKTKSNKAADSGTKTAGDSGKEG